MVPLRANRGKSKWENPADAVNGDRKAKWERFLTPAAARGFARSARPQAASRRLQMNVDPRARSCRAAHLQPGLQNQPDDGRHADPPREQPPEIEPDYAVVKQID